ncbi:RluA family pseudouridine synthase [Paenibacillus sp. N10]|uniref:Pseudouridine synthase n=2 Tax=Paenibacillus lutrae TaxID=2078573 RepID=A0A7X3FFR9_9BACL|nr:RluA family pseudouridine synthase [Paenibacillus lutrae]
MMNYYAPIIYQVPPEEEGFYLKTILHNKLGLSRKLVSRLKQTEQGITVNGRREYISIKVQSGDRIELRMEEEESEDILPQDIPLEILYEDEHLLIVNKEPGMIVHPTHGHYVNTIANGVVHHWKQRGENVRFRPIHRLDQETSGVLAIAKNPYVHQQISEQMIARTIHKEYLALVHGSVAEDKGTIDAPIDRDPEEPHVRIVTPDGYRAVTHYEVVQRYAGLTLVRLMLETGRTHQIRVHMKHLGHPLLGDKMYGAGSGEAAEACDRLRTEAEGDPSAHLPAAAAAGCELSRQALHAYRLAFDHPGTRNRVEFTAPLPADMQAVIDACG